METQTLNIADLVEAPVNPMVHSKENLEAIRRSIVRFGQVAPLVIRQANSEIIAGNARYRVMRELGRTECECVVLDIGEHEAKALAIAIRANELASEDPNIMDTLAEAYYAAGDYASAIDWEEKALSFEPDNDFFKEQLMKFREAGE